jgi:hypothetical protein
MYLLELGKNVDARGSAANALWITLTLAFLTAASLTDLLGFFAALLVFIAFSNQFKLEFHEAKRGATRFVRAHFYSAQNEQTSTRELVETNAFLLKMGLSSQTVPLQDAEASQAFSLKGTTFTIFTHELPPIVLNIEGPTERSSEYSLTAAAPWTASLMHFRFKGCYVESVSTEVWRIVEGAAELWVFQFNRGIGTLRCAGKTLKVLFARVVSEKGAVHLFTTTALDTEKLVNARWGVLENDVKKTARYLSAQTTCFTDRADGTRVVHRGMWLALACEDAYLLMLHTPMNNRVMVLWCCGKPTTSDATETLKRFHAREPLRKIKARNLQIVDCLQGYLHASLTGTDLFGPNSSYYVRFKPQMPLFDLEKPQHSGLGKEQTCFQDKKRQVTLSI